MHRLHGLFGETYLRRLRSLYANYYNEAHTHLSLWKDAPIGRPVERFGRITTEPIVGGLHAAMPESGFH
jgi:hypothetical protein